MEGGFDIVVACVAQSGERGYHLRVSPSSAGDWLREILEHNGAGEVVVRDESEHTEARGPWVALTVGLGAITLFAWSLLAS